MGIVLQLVEPELGKPISHIGLPGLNPGYSLLPFQLPANVPGAQCQAQLKCRGALEFVGLLTPGLGLTQHGCWQALGE